MRTFKLVALTNAVEGKDHEFNEWYDTRHLRDVLDIPGFISAQRFEMVGQVVTPERLYRYCALYEIVTDDPDGVLGELRARAGGPLMQMSDALAQEIHTVLYEARSPVVHNPSQSPPPRGAASVSPPMRAMI